jgi:predicted nuclease of predicted toxin-antitoxin system
MKLWLDAQLSPALAQWMRRELNTEAVAVRDLGLRDAKDTEIFQRAKEADVIVMTKDSDFVVLLERFGPPPKVLWVTCGNTSNERMREILRARLLRAMALFDAGEALVEISEPR